MRRWRRLALRGAAGAVALMVLAVAGTLTWGCMAAPGLVARRAAAAGTRVPAASLPAGFVEILLAVEDPAFHSHNGVDLTTPGAGLTTITQALCKDLFFDRFRPGLAKIPQTLFALALDRRVAKTDQLDLFVNIVYMGRHGGTHVEGLPAAARAYFGKDLAALSDDEFIALVGMILAPDRLNPASHPEDHARRARRIRRLLAGACSPAGLRDVHYEACEP